ncbi:type II toxin-antitoxin system HicB family antitoxin [Patescibacteria group bacterium]|nr:type II toxin-antitoxin system HicB family antitoxin [Patescibacteria group bacterium]MBU4467087.1 type II toxin-antitoxin system HicB family antitoxin [Patescibacteria group bacterium]
MRKIDLKSVVWRERKHYVSQCLNVDVSSYGATKKEALENLREALELYFQDSKAAKPTIIEQPDVVSLTLSHA